nr:platelet endothelial aggregation receptor 1-like [Biomphalaria glabrata]
MMMIPMITYCTPLKEGDDDTYDNLYTPLKEGDDDTYDNLCIPLKEGDDDTYDNLLHTFERSTHPIQVLYFHKSTCKARPDKPSSEEGGPSVTIIVPTNLFYFKYIWGSPYELGEHHYITIIIKTIYVNDIYHNGVHLKDKIPWQNVYDPFYKSDWKTGMMSASPRYLHILSSPKTSFGCYLYGFNGHTSYISPAGFLTSHINTYCTSSVSTMKIDDLVDNDCDLQVDEELENGVDDDDDRQIDEDLRSEGFIPTTESAVSTMSKVTNTTKVPTTLFPRNASGTVPGKTAHFITTTLPNATTMEPSTTFRTTRITPRTNWRSTEDYTAHLYSPWSIWQCDENCYETRQKRTRVCLVEECTEQVLQWRKAECYVMYTCPKFCKDFEWGIGCNKSCANCLDTCDKYNGSCTTCLPFFTSPANGCQSEILGVWQEWTCAEECHIKSMYRKRLCTTMEPNCTKVQMKSGSCHINTCPKDCPPFKWGADCKYSCANCESDCDKYNGSCTRCKPGFKNQRAGCLQECDRFKFGVNCSQDCKTKCNQDDCGDRRTGECPVHGKFGHWTAWHCTRNCLETRMSRERFCNHPQPRLGGLECQGHAQEWKTSVCYLRKDKICPIDCPEQKWGVDCGNECPNCLDDCDKFFGNCTMCKKGFKNASHSCNAGCDRNEFGFDCQGDCVAKCGEDCKDRVHGFCKDPSFLLVASISTIFILLPFIVYFLKRQELPKDKSFQKTRASKRQELPKNKSFQKTRASKRQELPKKQELAKDKSFQKTRASKRQELPKDKSFQLFSCTSERGDYIPALVLQSGKLTSVVVCDHADKGG